MPIKNQARITTFSLTDPDNVLYAHVVITFARKIGLIDNSVSDAQFSFSDVYDPVTFDGARFCDARVWSVFSNVMGSAWSNEYLSYAQGYDLSHRMPLFVYPTQKLSVQDVMQLMRSHYENSPLDMSGNTFSDVGAVTNSIYRAHPLTWSSSVQPDGVTVSADSKTTYLHERPIATPQTGWNYVAQSRASFPRELQGLLWFGVDDSGTTVRLPIYGSATQIPKAYAGQGPQDGVVPPMMTFNWQSAFYVFNVVANFAYNRWDLIYPELKTIITNTETTFLQQIQALDKEALALYAKQGPKAAVELVTNFSLQTAENLMTLWQSVFGNLFVKYRDGYVITTNTASTNCGCDTASACYPQAWYDRIVKDTKDHYQYNPSPSTNNKTMAVKSRKSEFQPVPKTSLKALR